jgi:hypothetical protein
MLFGLWMDAERIAVHSQVRQAHPEWVATAYDGQQRLGDLLDLTNPAAAAWMEEQIARVIAETRSNSSGSITTWAAWEWAPRSCATVMSKTLLALPRGALCHL